MKPEDKLRILEASLKQFPWRIAEQDGFIEGATYEHNYLTTQVVEAERKGRNEAIDAVLLRLAYLGVFQDKSHPRYTEIQKLKK